MNAEKIPDLTELELTPEARVNARKLADAILGMVGGALEGLPLPFVRGLARDLWQKQVRPAVLWQIDLALGGDGDPRGELPSEAPPAAPVEPEAAPPLSPPSVSPPRRGLALRRQGLKLRRF